jgi:flavin reductase (DIM6/NTAB) family NADH-FMN oxidoreductase RutF
MSRVAGAVHLVATDGPAGRGGLTASAVSSVTDAPPTLLACINATSRSARLIRENGVFSVNTLAARHEPIAKRFAQSAVGMEERFALGEWQTGPAGLPWLSGALASFALDVVDLRQVGSHMVVIGTVRAASSGAIEPPLVYHRRGYHTLAE